MLRSDLLSLPMHARGALVVNLHAVHPHVAFARLRITRSYAGQSNESARVFRPALQDREVEQGKIVALDHFLAWSGGNRARKKLAHLREQGKHLELVEEALGRLYIHEHPDTTGDLVE